MTVDWRNYPSEGFYDETILSKGEPRKHAERLTKLLANLSDEELEQYRIATELAIKEMGISFTVYSQDDGSIDRNWPLDIFPRIMPKDEWDLIEAGLKQRVKALNMFITDLYNDQNIIKDNVVPKEILKDSKNFRPECVGITPPFGVWAHICGSDLVRDSDGTMYVLEDNLRVPSGVSYMLENREVMKRVFPELFETYTIYPVDGYVDKLFEMLAALSPRKSKSPEVVVLTPGIYNSAYFEHSYLAQRMGAELVEGRDLIVKDDCVFMITVYGLKQVDVIYRRIDDEFLDPEVFNKESTLGVPGLMRAWKKGNVALANAPGAGVADDKVVYAYVPKIIEYYLKEKPLIPNVPTHLCVDKDTRQYVLDNLEKLVVKPANESGGYGMLIGPASSAEEREEFKKLIEDNPRNYIAQPTLSLSTVPTLIDSNAKPRHVDMRPFILSSETTSVTTGGLTRVALVEGSLVVNSSQGGGSKDTWIVEEK